MASPPVLVCGALKQLAGSAQERVQENSEYAVVFPEYFHSFQWLKAQGVSESEESSLYSITVLSGRYPVAPFAVSRGKDLHSWTMQGVKAASCWFWASR